MTYLCKGLKAEEFVQSEVDQYIFLWDDCILLVYVDDMIVIPCDVKVIDELVLTPRKEYALGDEESLTKYLGVVMKI